MYEEREREREIKQSLGEKKIRNIVKRLKHGCDEKGAFPNNVRRLVGGSCKFGR
jgi:hypothetical protein